MRRVNFAAAVDDILLLIRTGRVNMATTLLEGLVDYFDDVVEQIADHAYQEGRHDMAREITGTAAKPKRQPAPKRHEWLRARIANPELRERAKATLRLNDELLDAVADGGVGLSPGSWRRLREALGR